MLKFSYAHLSPIQGAASCTTHDAQHTVHDTQYTMHSAIWPPDVSMMGVFAQTHAGGKGLVNVLCPLSGAFARAFLSALAWDNAVY